MERKVPFVEGEFYHLYNRGVDKRIIFDSPGDYERFKLLLYFCNSIKEVRIADLLKSIPPEELYLHERADPLIAIGAFCLMPNHFHVLATPLVPNGISRFMLKLQTGYSMYFNTKYERSGSLFQGPFRSQHAAGDNHLKYLFSYIHLNPAALRDTHWRERTRINKKLLSYTKTYPYSSASEYLHSPVITSPKKFPPYLHNRKAFSDHLTDWLFSRATLEKKENNIS